MATNGRDIARFSKIKKMTVEKHSPTMQSANIPAKNQVPRNKPTIKNQGDYFQTQYVYGNANREAGNINENKNNVYGVIKEAVQDNKTFPKNTKKQEKGFGNMYQTSSKTNQQTIIEKPLVISQALRQKLQSKVHIVQPVKESDIFVRSNLICYICLQGLQKGQLIVMQKCKHGLHKECFLPGLQIQLSQGRTDLSCPFEGCQTSNLSSGFLHKVLSTKDRQRLNRFQAHIFVESKRRDGILQPCQQPNCKQLFKKKGKLIGKQGDQWYICNTSKQKYCLKCNRKYHREIPDCLEYQKSLDPNSDEYKLLAFIKQAGFKQCPKCRKYVEKNEGCNHITCKCKHQFCYACGGPYPHCNCLTVVEHRERMMRGG